MSAASFHEPKSFQQFIQMWLVIFSYLTTYKRAGELDFSPFITDLVFLAQLTPYLVYMSEFSLMLRMGSNKDILEGFIDLVF